MKKMNFKARPFDSNYTILNFSWSFYEVVEKKKYEKENEKNGLIVQMVRNTVKWLQEIFLMNILKIWKKWSR